MDNIFAVEADLLNLSTSKRIALIKLLEQNVDDDVNAATNEITERMQIAEMEQRLADSEAGLVSSRPWNEIEAELRGVRGNQKGQEPIWQSEGREKGSGAVKLG